MQIKFKLNGKERVLETSPAERVLDLLRRIGILSVRKGCDNEGTCGSCSILLDGRLVNSCLILSPQIDGKEIITSEGLSTGKELDPIQDAFIEAGLVQCGYCSPAMVLAVKELFTRHSNPTKEEVKDFLSGVLCRCTGYEQVFDAVKRIQKRMGGETLPPVCEGFREELRIVGRPFPKVDGKKLLTGVPCYVEDIIKPNSLFIKVLSSPYPHAVIRNINTQKAEAMPGVVAVFTHKNVPKTLYNSAGQGYPEPSPYDRRLIDDRVRFIGDRVAIVAAESMDIAEDAAKEIEVEYDLLPQVLTLEDAMKEGTYPIHSRDLSVDPLHIGAEPSKNIAASNKGGIGDLEKGFKEADIVIEREYRTGRVHACPVEPHVCHTYIKDERLIIHASTQVPWHVRRIVAYVLGIRENQIRVIKERVGGGFGVKQDIVLEDIAAWVTWQTGRPAFIKYSREEEFISSRTRHPMKFKIKVGAKKDGELTAISMLLLADTGAYGSHCLTVPMNACSKSLPIFRCPNVYFEIRSYYTNNLIAGAYQGYGAPQGTFAVQMAMAELAEELKMDHAEFLKKNMVRTGDLLEILKCLGEGQEGIAQKVSSCGLEECLTLGCKEIEWQDRATPKSPVARSGKGVAIIQQGSGLPGIDSANAEIRMLLDGSFMLFMGGTDLGTGLDTLAIKIVAEVLSVDPKSVSLIAADTDITPFDKGAYASSGTYFSGGAVHKASLAMKEKIIGVAAKILKEEKENLNIIYPGKVAGKSGETTFAKISQHALGGRGDGELVATASFTIDKSPIPYGAHFVQVEVDKRTGKVNIDRYLAYQDCGTPINPELALGQVYGGILKSIGHSLYEDMIFNKDGKCLNPNFLDYKVPMIKDLPDEVKAKLVFVKEELGPFGAKSVSEISTNGAAPAIASAIHDAVGVWIREWPFSSEKIYEAIKAKRDGKV